MVASDGQRASHLRVYLSLLCSGTALLLMFFRFLEFDAPLTRFVRSLYVPYNDHLRHPWLAKLSDIGNQIGSGESLLAVSVILILAGYALRANFKPAGWETLLAHAVAGGVNTAIKHSVGRGRPKFMHTDTSIFVPFGGRGWDSFPSGHSMAAFAIATVLAVRFPRVGWIMIGMALAVSASRLFRASHFLSDIVIGAVFGVLIGMVVAHPWKDWRASLTAALFMVTPPMAALLAVMTAIGQSPLEGGIDAALCQGGLLLALTALTAYVLIRVRPDMIPAHVTRTRALALMGVGVAMCSGSMWVTMVIVLVYLSHWLRMGNTTQPAKPPPHPICPYEAAFGLTVLLTLYAMLGLRGVLPMG
jgi:membrane-associated phospholipid phosphatase